MGNPAILSKGRRSMHLELIDHYEGMYLHMEKWPVRECQTHFHPDIEFMLMLNGKVECLTSSQNFLLTAGDIFQPAARLGFTHFRVHGDLVSHPPQVLRHLLSRPLIHTLHRRAAAAR